MQRRNTAVKKIAAIVAGAMLIFSAACSQQSKDSEGTSPSESSNSAAQSAEFPRTIETLNGAKQPTTITIEQQPKRIVSASVSLTGSLLSIDAPIVASGGGNGESPMFTKDEGFGIQWADKAKEKGVESMWQLQPNVEAILAQNPELVIMSSVGGDQALDLYDQLASDVPVMVIDYSDKSWEDVTTMMGKATGLEKNADEVIKKYEDRVTEVKNSINLPPQPVNIVSMTPESMNFFTSESAQGRIFTSVGFEVATPPQELIGETSIGRQRSDAVGVVPENFGPALTGETVFAQTLKAEGKTSDKIRQNPQLAQAPAVTADRLYDLNPDAFRIDYYSAMNVLNNLEGWFKK